MTRILKTPKLPLFAFLFFAFVCTNAGANTLTAGSCAQSAVQAAVNSAADGDAVIIPAGSCTWTAGVTVRSGIGITITGTGTPDSTPATTGASASCSNTTITVTGSVVVFRANPTVGNSLMRLSCMNITYGSGAPAATGFSILGTETSSGAPNLRLDNLTFTNWAGHNTAAKNGYGIGAVGDMFGVLDHNTINGAAGSYLQLVELSHASYRGVGFYGDNSWNQPENYGSSNFLFIENNVFNTAGCCENEGTAGGLQNQGGGRVVVRFNQFNSMDNLNFSMGWHGTESSGRPRSGRAFEYYQNIWSCGFSPCGTVASIRGGTGLNWGNTTNTANLAGGGYFHMGTYRMGGAPSPPWGSCDGSQPWDTNDGVTYFSGTIGSVSGSGPYTITVSGTSPGWTTSQWFQNGAPYSVHDVAQNSGGEIQSNGANTLTIRNNGGPSIYIPAVGDSIQILRATVCIDQAGGRGAGILYSGISGPNNVPSPVSSANELLSPVYLWLNAFNPGTPPGGIIGSQTARIIQNRDFYTENSNQAAQSSPTAPFDGTTTIGLGHGSLANRPTTCTPGVGYWATDQGNWNQSGSGEQGEFFTCASANTWTETYQPYTYPHPITQGQNPPPPPAAPLSVSVTSVK